MTTHHSPGSGRRIGAAGLAAAVLLAACGSSGTEVDTETVAAAADEVLEAPATTAPVAADATDAMPADETTDDDADGAMAADDQPAMVDEHPELDDTVGDEGTGDESATDAAPAPAGADLPALPVVDLLSGETVALDSLATPEPTLVWFWAPH